MLQFCRRLYQPILGLFQRQPPPLAQVADDDESDLPPDELTQEDYLNLRLEYERTLNSYHRSDLMVYAGVVYLITIVGSAIVLIVNMDPGPKQAWTAFLTFILVTLALATVRTWAERQYSINDLRAFRLGRIERLLHLWSDRYIVMLDQQAVAPRPLPPDLQSYVDGHPVETISPWRSITALFSALSIPALFDARRRERPRYLATRRRDANRLLYPLGLMAWVALVIVTVYSCHARTEPVQKVQFVDPVHMECQLPTSTSTSTPLPMTPTTALTPVAMTPTTASQPLRVTPVPSTPSP